jgi:thiol-disulfide isomerase/thioredoxin
VTNWNVLLIGLAALSIVEGVALVAVMRQVGRITLRLGQARPGLVEGGGPEVGSSVDADAAGIDVPALVMFMAPGCRPCRDLAPSLRAFAATYRDIHVAAVMTGPDDAETLADSRIRVLVSPELHEDWKVPGTPFAVGLADAGVVRAAGVVNNLEQLEVMRAAVFEPANRHEPDPPTATPVPFETNGRPHDDRTDVSRALL